MKFHSLKIHKEFADAIIDGIKSFEIRKDDRDYREGDYIIFNCIDPENEQLVSHPINDNIYRIIYLLQIYAYENGEKINTGLVVFEIKKVGLSKLKFSNLYGTTNDSRGYNMNNAKIELTKDELLTIYVSLCHSAYDDMHSTEFKMKCDKLADKIIEKANLT